VAGEKSIVHKKGAGTEAPAPCLFVNA
jgi:hypothetical protein